MRPSHSSVARNDHAAFVDHQPSPSRLPRGSSSLPKDVVEREQRRRLIQGIATAVTEKGYAAVTVADITRIAGVSRATFYALFKDKEDCFLYGLQKLADAQMTEVETEYAKRGPKRDVLFAALTAYVQRINADANLSLAFIAEAAGASPNIRAVYEQAIERFEKSLLKWLANVHTDNPKLAKVSSVRTALVMSALKAYIISAVRQGRTIDGQQVQEIYEFILASFDLETLS
jgi:AcrR family transcriptional regulator